MARYRHVGALPLVINAGKSDERHIPAGETFDADLPLDQELFWIRSGAIVADRSARAVGLDGGRNRRRRSSSGAGAASADSAPSE